MAEDKKSFVLYCDLVHTIELLSDEQAGKVFKHLLSYVNDEQPTLDDPLLKIAFEPIKRQLKRDLEKYEDTKQERSIQGRKGNLKRWNRDLYDRLENGELTLEEAEEIAISRKVSPPDSTQSPPIAKIAVNVNDTVNVNDNDNDINYIYSLYPTKCFVGNRSTGKTKKNKDKIKSLLKDNSKEQLEYIIKRYLTECRKTKTYLKNFATFLNNLPDFEQQKVNNTNEVPNPLLDPITKDVAYVYNKIPAEKEKLFKKGYTQADLDYYIKHGGSL